jgi:DNA-binding response OmpR family regulator
MKTIAIIEDNDDLRELTAKYLRMHGYNVLCFPDAETYLTSSLQAEIYIVDINLPEIDGFELIGRLRQIYSYAALIVLSARKMKEDVINGYDCGVDIYLSKPTEPEVLLAAVKRLEKRSQVISDDEKVIYISGNNLRYKNRSMDFSNHEILILEKLFLAGLRGLERYEILELLGFEFGADKSKALDVRVLRLRRKLIELGVTDEPILTLRGFGYRLKPTWKVKYNE